MNEEKHYLDYQENSLISEHEGSENSIFESGTLSTIASSPSMHNIISVLQSICDPEIPVNVYDMGLIYDLKRDSFGNIDIVMTLTNPNCPVIDSLPMKVANEVSCCEGVGRVRVYITWTPSWNIDMMSEDAKLALRI